MTATRGTVIALHGFSRAPQHLAGLAAACGRDGFGCLRPELAPRWAPMLINSRQQLARVADRVVSRLPAEPGPVVIVGHSAGAAAGSWLAPHLLTRGVAVAGLVMVDGVDSPNGLIREGWEALERVPIRAVMCPPSRCNRDGALTRFLEVHRPGVTEVIAGAGHGDIELADRAVYRLACGDDSSPAVKARVLGATLGAVRTMADG